MVAMKLTHACQTDGEGCGAQGGTQNRRGDAQVGENVDRMEVVPDPATAEAEDDQQRCRNDLVLARGLSMSFERFLESRLTPPLRLPDPDLYWHRVRRTPPCAGSQARGSVAERIEALTRCQ